MVLTINDPGVPICSVGYSALRRMLAIQDTILESVRSANTI